MRCVIVDDSPGFVDAARRLLDHDGIAVVGVASTSAEALRSIGALRPDVVLVDVNLGAENGFDLAEHIHRFGPSTPSPVIMISTLSEEDVADLMTPSPAIGFLGKINLTSAAIRDLVDGMATLDDGGRR
jgi:DNA-binding NarL/FixJ family response regulator